MSIVDTLEPTKLLAVIEDDYRTRWYRWSLDAPAPWRPMGAAGDWQDDRFNEIEYAHTIHEGYDEVGEPCAGCQIQDCAIEGNTSTPCTCGGES